MTEDQLLAAYGANADGSPVAIHREVRDLRNVVEATASEVRAIRELLEVALVALDVEVVADWTRETVVELECEECGEGAP
jgi:hypothetical protein